MTVSNENNKTYTIGNGVTTAFPFNNVLFADSALTVVLVDNSVTPATDTVQTLGVDYTVAIAGDNSSATVNMVVAPAATETLVIYRNQPDTQTTSYPEGGQFPAASHEDALDRGVLQSQTQEEMINRSLRLPATQQTTGGAAFDGELSKPTELKTFIGWDDTNQTMDMVNGITEKDAANSLLLTDAFLVSDSADSGKVKKVLYSDMILGDASALTGSNSVDTYVDGVDYTSGTTTQLTLGAAPGSENNTQIYFDGAYQNKTTYTVAGDVVTFDNPIPLGTSEIQCVRNPLVALGSLDENTDYTVNGLTANSFLNSNGTLNVTGQGTLGSIDVNGTGEFAGAVDITDTTASTSTTTGALTVAGGVGIQGDLNIGGDLNVDGSLIGSLGLYEATIADKDDYFTAIAEYEGGNYSYAVFTVVGDIDFSTGGSGSTNRSIKFKGSGSEDNQRPTFSVGNGRNLLVDGDNVELIFENLDILAETSTSSNFGIQVDSNSLETFSLTCIDCTITNETNSLVQIIRNGSSIDGYSANVEFKNCTILSDGPLLQFKNTFGDDRKMLHNITFSNCVTDGYLVLTEVSNSGSNRSNISNVFINDCEIGDGTYGAGVWKTVGTGSGAEMNVNYTNSSNITETLQSGSGTVTFTKTVSNIVGEVTLSDTTSATSTTSGALQVTGGISTQDNLHVGGEIVSPEVSLNGSGFRDNSPLIVESVNPNMYLKESGVSADSGNWELIVDGETFRIKVANDAGSISNSCIEFFRSGSSPDGVALLTDLLLSSNNIEEVAQISIESSGRISMAGQAGTPSSPVAGDICYNTTTNKHQGYDGSVWNDLY